MFELKGFHYHNPQGRDFGETFVARTLLKNLLLDEVVIPKEERWDGGPTTFPLKKLGIGHPVLITTKNVVWDNKLAVDDVEEETEKPTDAKAASKNKGKPPGRPGMSPNAPMGPPGAGGAQGKKKWIDAPRYDFVVQFCWQVPPPDTMAELATLYPGAVDPANAAIPVPAPTATDNGSPEDAAAESLGPAAEADDNNAETPAADGDEAGAAAADGTPPDKTAPDAAKGEEN